MSKQLGFPRHIAIIPDGNGRWAQKQGLDRIQGHVRGTANVKDIVTFAKDLGVEVLTIYAFSEENWLRPENEVSALMNLLKEYLIQERATILKNNIQLRTIGHKEKLPKPVLVELEKTIEASKHNREMVLNFAISYGSQQEILRAVKSLALRCETGEMAAADITADLFERHLYTAGLIPPDLLIRTSGEMRISNFLLWQLAYAEIYVTETLWPDFNRDEFMKAIEAYQYRERRYGMTSAQVIPQGTQEGALPC